MNFKDIKKDYPIYIFDRNGDMSITTGRALSDASTPHIDYEHGNNMQMIVEVSVEANGKSQVYVMPESACVSVAPNNVVISTDITPILKELESIQMRSEEIVKSAPMHDSLIKRCVALREEWSPELKQRRETDNRFNRIEDRIASIDDKFDLIMQQLKKSKD